MTITQIERESLVVDDLTSKKIYRIKFVKPKMVPHPTSDTSVKIAEFKPIWEISMQEFIDDINTEEDVTYIEIEED